MSAFPAFWLSRSVPARLLWPISLLFRIVVSIRRALYETGLLKSVVLDVPVLVVGNIFVGGTGKTPLVIWLVEQLRQAGYQPGVISRGFGGRSHGLREVNAESLPGDVGDEPVLIASRARCPVVTGRDRVAAARLLLATYPQVNVVVSDDGLQHYRLGRQLEIVLFDSRGVGNGWLLPAGPLREPATRTGDFPVLNAAAGSAPGVALNAYRMKLVGDTIWQLARPDQSQQLGAVQANQPRQRLLAAAGIGNPARFFDKLAAAGLEFERMALPDHFDFGTNPFAASSAEIILITEKDAVKCRHSDAIKNDPRLWVVPVSAELDGALIEKILERLRGSPPA